MRKDLVRALDGFSFAELPTWQELSELRESIDTTDEHAGIDAYRAHGAAAALEVLADTPPHISLEFTDKKVTHVILLWGPFEIAVPFSAFEALPVDDIVQEEGHLNERMTSTETKASLGGWEV